MVSLVATLASPQDWPASALLLAATIVILLVVRLLRRPDLPLGASWTERGAPLIGSLAFFTKRRDFLREGKERSPNGHFNFYYGSYPIIALSGEAARAAYFTTRGLDLSAGYGLGSWRGLTLISEEDTNRVIDSGSSSLQVLTLTACSAVI